MGNDYSNGGGKHYMFPCGCHFPLLEREDETPEGVLPLIDIDIEEVPVDCPATWALLGTGRTKGVFQLESGLGKSWTKKMLPENLENLGALGALLRPGSLKSLDKDGVSMTQHYVLRKNNKEEVKKYHPAIDAILFPTYGVLAYQEQAMFIAVAVAGFDESKADSLRKSIGKKLASEMKKCEVMFIDGAKQAGILTEEQAAEVFGWIKESQRYSFNKSHAICYGKIGYRDAYIKAHHPLAFFAGKLKNAKECADPKEEVSELVNDARLFGVTIEVPDLRLKNQLFQTDRKRIVFGLSNIRDIGEASFTKLIHAVEKIENESGRKIGDLTWMDFLVKYSHYFSPTAITRMIEAGALRWMGNNRKLMLNEYNAWDTLTEAKVDKNGVKENDKEKEFARAVYEREKYATLPLLLNAIAVPKKEGGGCHTAKRASIVRSVAQCLENPMTAINDSPMAIAVKEEELLGVSITHSRIDGCDASAATCTCKEYMDGYSGNVILAVSVASLMEKVTKGGKTPGAKMASGVMTDGTASVDFVVFPKEWEELGHFFSVGSTIIVSGQKGKDSDNFMVKKAFAALRSM